MTPFFALSFASDGIRLLHRAPEGWDLVGNVSLDAPDLRGALSKLRADARTLGRDTLECRLVIPHDQIRFDTLDDPQASRAQVEAALDGTTPYALDELAIDFLSSGDRTQIAACAHETLAEARAFAQDNGFVPVCYVAEPLHGGGEIFFGPVDPDREVVRETIAPVATGTVDLSATSPEGPAAPRSAQDGDFDDPSVAHEKTIGPEQVTRSGDPAVAASPDTDHDGDAGDRGTRHADRWGAQDRNLATAGTSPSVMAVSAGHRNAAPSGTRVDVRSEGDGPDAPLFTPRIRHEASGPDARTSGQGSDAPTLRATPARAAQDGRGRAVPRSEPVVGSRWTPSDPAPKQPADADGPDRTASIPAPAADQEPRPAGPRPAGSASRSSPGTATRAAAVGGAPQEALFTHRKAAPPASPPSDRPADAPRRRAPDAPSADRLAALEAAIRAPAITADAPDAAPPPSGVPYLKARARRAAAAKPTMDEDQIRGGTPRFMGLILTAALLIALLLAGFWASTLPDEGISWLFGTEEDAVETAGREATPGDRQATAPDPAADPSDGTDAAAAASGTDDAAPQGISSDAVLPGSIVTAPGPGVLSPDEADRIYAATGVWQRAPRIAVVPRAQITESPRPVSSAVTPVPTVARPAGPDAITATADLPLTAQADPPAPDVQFPRDPRGRILATAEGTVMPSGAVLFAGAPDLRPVPRPGTPVSVDDAGAPDQTAPSDDPAQDRGAPAIQPRARPDDLVPASFEPSDARDIDATAGPGASDPQGTTVPDANPVLGPAGTPPEGAPAPRPLGTAARASILTPPARGTGGILPSSPVDTLIVEAAAAEITAQSGPTDVIAPSAGPAVTVTQGAPARRPVPRPAGLAGAASPQAGVPAPAAAVPPVAVTLGAPDRRPPLRPIGFSSLSPRATIQPAPDWLSATRPPLRPGDGAPPAAQAAAPTDINSITAALAAAAAPSSFSNRTARAVGLTRRPDSRPRDFASTVARARTAPTLRQSGAVVERPATQPQVAAPATAAPVGRPAASVARAATQDDAVNMRRLNLVGVFGRPGSRRALVRLGNGRYVKVEVGSPLDGGQVTAIGDSALNFVKSGRTYALQLPAG